MLGKPADTPNPTQLIFSAEAKKKQKKSCHSKSYEANIFQ
jgi:hypothetical protein